MGMKNRFQEAIQNVQRQRHLARRSVAMVLVLAMLTAMSVSWRLHQDGIALAADDTRYYCGKEEHKHTDDCYIEGTEPICGYEEGEIVEETMDFADDAGDGDSSAADWDEAGSEPESEPATQEEPEPEVVLHHHTEDCYEEEEVLTYEVDRISIVLPTETDLLQPVEGQDYVTLMTCTPYGINTHRLLVRGHRVNTRESQKHVRVTADATRIDPIITAPVIALPMLAVLLIWLLVTTRKRPKAGKHEKTTRGDPHETNS